MPTSDERDRQEDLDATAESLRHDAKQVVEIEERKQGLAAGDPRVDTLSAEVEQLAGQIQRKSRLQRELSDREPADDADPGGRSN